eukprot:XP_019074114.1 PREDICTED: E3 ubiquitin-protein ligase RBBP6-like [Vitis vinifera]
MKPNKPDSKKKEDERSIPPKLHCPLCKLPMLDAVMVKCCFTSFCHRCISNCPTCPCGARVVSNDLLPNLTLRDIILRFQDKEYKGVCGRGEKIQVKKLLPKR